MKDAPRQHFRSAAHVSGAASAKPKDYEAAAEIVADATAAGIACSDLGIAGGDRMVVAGLVDLGVHEATQRWRSVLPEALGH